MPPIVTRAYARAGLLGNPSDGYHGRTISAAIQDFSAVVQLEPASRIEILPDPLDATSFDSMAAMMRQLERHGYYGGIRLVKAAIKRLYDYCRDQLGQQRPLAGENFRLCYSSDIPRRVGLAGSSAIVVATLRALMAHYQLTIPRAAVATLALEVESRELGIPAGLQDRVVQLYQGVVYMDFDRQGMATAGGLPCGQYQQLEARLLPQFYLAWTPDWGQGTEVLHSDLRARYERGDREVLAAIERLKEIAQLGRQALLGGDHRRFAELMDANFDQRQRVCQLDPRHVAMVQAARRAGTCANYCGSGGAIIGILPDQAAWPRLRQCLSQLGCQLIRPQIAPPSR